MRTLTRFGLGMVLSAGLFYLGLAHAKPPGDGDSVPPARYSVLELPIDGNPNAVSEANASGVLTVAIDSGEAGYVSAAFARVNRSTGAVIASGFLPEPPFVDPNDGVLKNGYSQPHDVNVAGQIAGMVPEFDPARPGSDPNTHRAVVWSFDGTRYSYELLPSLAPWSHSDAVGINNKGDVVGHSDGRAVLWDGVTHAVVDLNTEGTAALGWLLDVAQDINDDRVIVGRGRLAGAQRGFVLDRITGLILAIPLVGEATDNSGNRISAGGRVIGQAWNGEGVHYGTNPDYVRGFSWNGLGTDPVVLTPVTITTSLAAGLNDFGQTVGNSYIPTDDFFRLDQVPTLWEFDDQGNLLATDLTTQIPAKPAWFLVRALDVNNDGWVSVYGRKFVKGKYVWRALLLVPSSQ